MPPDASERARTGHDGEEAAARYLTQHGCTILARNWHAHPGEVDIVAECPALSALSPGGKELAFIEVRTRHGRAGLAEESISRRKAASMAAAAYAYMASRHLDPDITSWRIDLLAISMSGPAIDSINWIRGVLDEDMLEA